MCGIAFCRRRHWVRVTLLIGIGIVGFTAAGAATAWLRHSSLPPADGPLQVQGVLALARVLSVLVLLLAVFSTVNAVGGDLALGALAGTGLGIAAGLALGWLFASVVARPLGFGGPSLSVPWYAVVESMGVGLGVPMLAALIAVAMRVRVGSLETVPGPAPVRGVAHRRHPDLRPLIRYPLRTAVAAAALGLSGAAVLSVTATIDSANQARTAFFAQYQAAAFVTVPTAPATEVRAVLDHVPGVVRVEPLEQTQARTRYGDVIITATEPDTELYRSHLLSGTRLTNGEMGAVLLSRSVAAASGLRGGSELTVSVRGETERWRVIGIVRDENTHVGTLGAVFTSLAQIHQLDRVPRGAERGWMLRTHDNSSPAARRLSTDVRTALAAAGIHAEVQTAPQIMQEDRAQLQRYILFVPVAVLSACVGLLAIRDAVLASARARRLEAGPPAQEVTRRHLMSVFLPETLAYALLGWVVAGAVGIVAGSRLMGLMSGGELLSWPFQPLAVDQAGGVAATPMLLSFTLLLMVVIALLGGALALTSARRGVTRGAENRPSEEGTLPGPR